MPHDVEGKPWRRWYDRRALFAGPRSHRRRGGLTGPRSALLGIVVLLAGGALLASQTGDLPAVPDRPPAPDGVAQPAPDPWLTSGPPAPEPSVTPSPGSSATAPAAPSAAPGVRPGAATPLLSIARGDVPAVVDLAAEGRRDWVHWAQQDMWSLERRRDGQFAILEGTPTAPRVRHDDSVHRFTWRDGTPVADAEGARTGVRTCGTGSGFTLSAPAGRTERTLKVYVGAWRARGVLTAALSTGGDPVTATLDAPGSVDAAVYTVTYRAPRDGRVRLAWTTDQAYGGGCSGVALQAATLR